MPDVLPVTQPIASKHGRLSNWYALRQQNYNYFYYYLLLLLFLINRGHFRESSPCYASSCTELLEIAGAECLHFTVRMPFLLLRPTHCEATNRLYPTKKERIANHKY